MAELIAAPHRLFRADGTLAYGTGDPVPVEELRHLLTDAQVHAQHTTQGPRESRPGRTETRRGGTP